MAVPQKLCFLVYNTKIPRGGGTLVYQRPWFITNITRVYGRYISSIEWGLQANNWGITWHSVYMIYKYTYIYIPESKHEPTYFLREPKDAWAVEEKNASFILGSFCLPLVNMAC